MIFVGSTEKDGHKLLHNLKRIPLKTVSRSFASRAVVAQSEWSLADSEGTGHAVIIVGQRGV